MAHNHDDHTEHVTPLDVYLKVAGGLFFLTFLTVLTVVAFSC